MLAWIPVSVFWFVSPLKAQNLKSLWFRSQYGPDTTQVAANLDLAWFYVKSRTDSSLFYASRALRKSIETNYVLGQMRAHSNLGVAYAMAGDMKSSIDHNLKTYELAVALKRYKAYPVALINIANGYYEMKDYSNALHYYNKTIAEAQLQKDLPTRISALNEMSDVYAKLGEFEKAAEVGNQAFRMAEDCHDSLRMAQNLYITAERESVCKNYAKSTDCLLRSLALRKSNDEFGQAICYRQLALNYLYLEQFNKADQYLKVAERLVVKNGNLKEIVNTMELRAQLYERTGHLKEALATYTDYWKLKDSLNSESNKRYTSALQIRFDVDQKQMELDKITAQVEKERLLKWMFLIVGTVLLIMIVFSFLFYRKRNRLLVQENANVKEKVRLEQEQLKNLELKNALEKEKGVYEEQKRAMEQERMFQELERAELERQRLALELDEQHRSLLTNSMQREQQKEFLVELSSELGQMRYQSDKRQLQKNLEQLYRLVKGKIHQEDDWERIKLYFEKVHPQFFEKLKAKHPGLSVNDLKFCAYTKMNLNSKEISRLLNINPSSVQVSRYRLKRKLNLAEEASFHDYIGTNF